MNKKTILKILFLTLLLSSCGLIERFKTSEEPTDSKEAAVEAAPQSTDKADDLFAQTMDETKNASAENLSSDAPNNIALDDGDLKSLEDEFATGDQKSQTQEPVAETSVATKEMESEKPIQVEEVLPEIKTEAPAEALAFEEEGKIKNYQVKKGETLMQIAFKIYGDISKWKELKEMNTEKFSGNLALRPNTQLQYKAPATPFVWNPEGTPYMIKNGETLGTISNTVYSTPKKWKHIWNNNKPLIKNPNVIYAGFTLYYTRGDMANFVQPKALQTNKEEEIIVEKEILKNHSDETGETLSAPQREEQDLVNRVAVPHEEEVSPDIDEELQTL